MLVARFVSHTAQEDVIVHGCHAGNSIIYITGVLPIKVFQMSHNLWAKLGPVS